MKRSRPLVIAMCFLVAIGTVPAPTTVNVENTQTVTGNKTFTGVTTLGTTNVTGTLAVSGGGAIVASTLTCTNCVDMSSEVATFNSSTLAGRVTDETGSGAVVFATAPTFTGDIAVDTDATHGIGTRQLRVDEVQANELGGYCPSGPVSPAGATVCFDPDAANGNGAWKLIANGRVQYLVVSDAPSN